MKALLVLLGSVLGYLSLLIASWTNGYTLGKARGEESVCGGSDVSSGIVPASLARRTAP